MNYRFKFMKAKAILFSLLFLTSVCGIAQEVKSPASYNGPLTLQQQFNTIKNRSAFQPDNRDFKVVRITRLDNFWQSVQDSLKARENNIKQAGRSTADALQKAQKNIAGLENELQRVKQENLQKEKQIQQTTHNISHLSVLGIDINKQVYVVISWIIILGLMALAGIFAYLYKNSKKITDEKIKAFEEISQEYKQHKQSAREKETKIKRDLQTEVNRVDELKQEIAQLRKQASI